MTPTARLVLLPEEVSRPAAHSLLGSPVTVFAPGRPPFWAYFPAAFEQPVTGACLREGVAIEERLHAHANSLTDADETTRLKRLLNWDRLAGPAQSWWHRLEPQDEAAFIVLLRGLANESQRMGAIPTTNGSDHGLLEDLFQVSRQCRSADGEVLLAYLRYWLLDQASKRSREAPGEEKSPG